MPIVSIADVSSKAGWTPDGGRTYTAELEVLTDAPEIGGKAVVDALNLFATMTYRWPFVGTATESDERCALTSVDAEPTTGDRKQWRVTLQFQPRSWEGDQKGPVDEDGNRDPFQARPTLRTRSEVEEIAALKDRDGVPILNTAGDPFDPPLPRNRRTIVFEITRLERYFDPDLIDQYEDAVNATEWLGRPAESFKVLSITGDCNWVDDVGGYAWTVVYTIGYRKPVETSAGPVSGWADLVLNAGLRQKVAGARKQITVDNAPVASPVPLKADGTAAAPADDPVYLTFKLCQTADFDELDLPADLLSIGTPEPDPDPDPEPEPEGP